jgi:acyl carrier protein
MLRNALKSNLTMKYTLACLPFRMSSLRLTRQIDNGRSVRNVMGFSVGMPMTQEQISELCVASLANVLRTPKDRVKTDIKFSRLGLDSAMVVYVILELEEKLDLELSTEDFYDHPTVDELSHFLAEKRATRPVA